MSSSFKLSKKSSISFFISLNFCCSIETSSESPSFAPSASGGASAPSASWPASASVSTGDSAELLSSLVLEVRYSLSFSVCKHFLKRFI